MSDAVGDAMTARITNPKVATLTPTWRRYCGASVLFDNPGARVVAGVTRLDEQVLHDPRRQRLYDDLATVVVQVDAEVMRERYGFCPLPRTSYHVTLCDGPNDRNLDTATAPQRAAAAWIARLPHSVDRPPAVLDVLCRSRVLDVVTTSPVTFGVTGVAIWDHVLAVTLEPGGPSSRTAFTRVELARAELADALRSRLGLQIRPWRPHVSLGYFPNRDAAAAAMATLPTWKRRLRTAPLPPITFDSAAVYGFTDMVSFLRLG